MTNDIFKWKFHFYSANLHRNIRPSKNKRHKNCINTTQDMGIARVINILATTEVNN